MLKIGNFNILQPFKETSLGTYFQEENASDTDPLVLVPLEKLPNEYNQKDPLNIFVYLDADELLVGTTEKPAAECGGFAYLEVAKNTKYGSFMNWGLDKDLFVSFKEQKHDLFEGDKYLIHVYLDEATGRICGSTKIKDYLKHGDVNFEKNQEVDVLVWERTTLGMKLIVNQSCEGLVFHNEIFQNLEIGSSHKAYIKTVRHDGKLDLSMQPTGYRNIIEPTAQKILDHLEENQGHSPLSDKSTPELIYITFGMSKKAFKKALGSLYKARRITISPEGIKLNSDKK